jgi:hypothetical protein
MRELNAAGGPPDPDALPYALRTASVQRCSCERRTLHTTPLGRRVGTARNLDLCVLGTGVDADRLGMPAWVGMGFVARTRTSPRLCDRIGGHLFVRPERERQCGVLGVQDRLPNCWLRRSVCRSPPWSRGVQVGRHRSQPMAAGEADRLSLAVTRPLPVVADAVYACVVSRRRADHPTRSNAPVTRRRAAFGSGGVFLRAPW